MQLVTLKIFGSQFDAYLFKSKLDSEGIDSFIFGEYILKHSEGVKVMIRKIDIERAKQILEEYDIESKKIKSCPQCDSKDIVDIQETKSILGKVSTFFKVILTVFIPFIGIVVQNNATKQNKCNQCSYEF